MNSSADIQLEFTPENVRKVLLWGVNPETAPYTHQAIVSWSEKFWNKYSDVDASKEIDAVMPILADIETQWDIYTAVNKEAKQMPREWFVEWLSKIYV